MAQALDLAARMQGIDTSQWRPNPGYGMSPPEESDVNLAMAMYVPSPCSLICFGLAPFPVLALYLLWACVLHLPQPPFLPSRSKTDTAAAQTKEEEELQLAMAMSASMSAAKKEAGAAPQRAAAPALDRSNPFASLAGESATEPETAPQPVPVPSQAKEEATAPPAGSAPTAAAPLETAAPSSAAPEQAAVAPAADAAPQAAEEKDAGENEDDMALEADDALNAIHQLQMLDTTGEMDVPQPAYNVDTGLTAEGASARAAAAEGPAEAQEPNAEEAATDGEDGDDDSALPSEEQLKAEAEMMVQQARVGPDGEAGKWETAACSTLLLCFACAHCASSLCNRTDCGGCTPAPAARRRMPTERTRRPLRPPLTRYSTTFLASFLLYFSVLASFLVVTCC